MPRRVLWVCHGCGSYIYSDQQSKVVSSADGKHHHYHYDNGRDCLAGRYTPDQLELDLEHVAVLGDE